MNALVPIIVTVFGIFIDNVVFNSPIDVKLLQPKNVQLEIFVKFGLAVGNFICCNCVQPWKAPESKLSLPMVETDSGIIIDLILLQSLKALLPIIVTVFGIVIDNVVFDSPIDVKLLQPKNVQL